MEFQQTNFQILHLYGITIENCILELSIKNRYRTDKVLKNFADLFDMSVMRWESYSVW